MSYGIPKTPKEMMDFNASGKLPLLKKAPTTPLLELILLIPRPMWSQMGTIKLSPKLGFNNGTTFRSLSELAIWLGHNSKIRANQRMPYMSYQIANFKTVKFDVFLSHLNHSLSESQIDSLKGKLPNKHR